MTIYVWVSEPKAKGIHSAQPGPRPAECFAPRVICSELEKMAPDPKKLRTSAWRGSEWKYSCGQLPPQPVHPGPRCKHLLCLWGAPHTWTHSAQSHHSSIPPCLGFLLPGHQNLCWPPVLALPLPVHLRVLNSPSLSSILTFHHSWRSLDWWNKLAWIQQLRPPTSSRGWPLELPAMTVATYHPTTDTHTSPGQFSVILVQLCSLEGRMQTWNVNSQVCYMLGFKKLCLKSFDLP